MDLNPTPALGPSSTCHFYDNYAMSDLTRRRTLFLAHNIIQSSPPPDDWKVSQAYTNATTLPDATFAAGLSQSAEVLFRAARDFQVRPKLPVDLLLISHCI